MDSTNAAREAYDALPLQVWTARVDGTLDFVNARVAEFFRVDRQQVLDHGWKDLCHPLDLIAANEKWRKSLLSGLPYEVSFRLLSGMDNQFRWHIGRAEPMRDEAGKVSGWLGYNTDVDALRRAEEVTAAALAHARFELARAADR